MRANTCSFNAGVIVANLTEWKHQNITQQLEMWMERNVKWVAWLWLWTSNASLGWNLHCFHCVAEYVICHFLHLEIITVFFSFTPPGKVFTATCWQTASPHHRYLSCFTSATPALSPCGTSDISVRISDTFGIEPKNGENGSSWNFHIEACGSFLISDVEFLLGQQVLSNFPEQQYFQ